MPAHLEKALGVAVVVLRLLDVDDDPLRMPWVRASGVRELLAWAAEHVTVTGRAVQRKTWNPGRPVPAAGRRRRGLAEGHPAVRGG